MSGEGRRRMVAEESWEFRREIAAEKLTGDPYGVTPRHSPRLPFL
jgi:hypothetical protein